MKRLKAAPKMMGSDGWLSQALATILVCLLLLGCTAGHEDTLTPTTVPSTNATPIMTTPTETARLEITDVIDIPIYPTYTSTPEPTFPPTSTFVAMPDVPLNPEGPWLLFTSGHLYAINDDGGGLTQLLPEYISFYAVQPGRSLEEGVMVAAITRTNYDSEDLTLKLLKLPEGKAQTVTPLILNETPEVIDSLGFELQSLAGLGGLAWSPDGRTLAFIGGMDGESVDVYAYDTITEQITRLTDGPLHAYHLSWSADSQFVIHDATWTTMCMNCPQADAMFAARADGLGAIQLISLPEVSYGSMQIHHWLTTKKVLVSSQYFSYEDETRGAIAQVVDLETGEATPVLRGPYIAMAYSPTGGVWLLRPADDESGLILILYSYGEEQEITFEGIVNDIWWSERYDTFFVETAGKQLFTINDLGEVTELLAPLVEDWSRPSAQGVKVSPDEVWWAWQEYHWNELPFLWVGRAMVEPVWIELPGEDDSMIGSAIWSLDSQRLFFADDADGLWYADPPDFEPVRVFSDLRFVSDFTWIPAQK